MCSGSAWRATFSNKITLVSLDFHFTKMYYLAWSCFFLSVIHQGIWLENRMVMSDILGTKHMLFLMWLVFYGAGFDVCFWLFPNKLILYSQSGMTLLAEILYALTSTLYLWKKSCLLAVQMNLSEPRCYLVRSLPSCQCC